MEDLITSFQQAMSEIGLYCEDPIIADGQLHRFTTTGDSKPNSWYVLFNQEIPVGVFGCWKRNIKGQWCPTKITELRAEEYRLITQSFSEAKQAYAKEKEKQFEETADRAMRIWQRCKEIDVQHPYITRKKIVPNNARIYKNLLIIPLQDLQGKIWSLQFIDRNGHKRFLKNGRKKGLCHILGDVHSTPIYLCEGYATGCTIFTATQACVTIAFDSGNLSTVAKILRNQFPDKEIIICADNDQFTPNNTGLNKAKEAADLIKAKITFPNFVDTESKPTDFNDLFLLEGIERVKQQLNIPHNEKCNTAPAGFLVKDEGVFSVSSEEDQDYRKPFKICARLDVVARTREENGMSHGRLLVFKDPDGKQHQWALPLEMLAGEGMEYRRILLNRGLFITPARKAYELLTHYILSSKPQRAALCVDRTGWNDGSYIFQDETIGQSTDEIIFQGAKEENIARCAGALADWQNSIAKYCENNSRVLFAVSVAFASAILHLLGEESGGFHFVGPSSIGKTTLLQVAGSVWGGPERLQRWRATSNGLEAIASLHNDSLLCLDEIGQIDAREISEVAYMLANGSGKGRCRRDGSIRKKNIWRLLFLSTGEMGLSDHVNQSGKKIRAGQEVRFIDLLADAEQGLGIFEDIHNFSTAADFSRYLNESSKKYYGTVIRDFLRNTVKDIDYACRLLTKTQAEFLKTHVPSNSDGQVYRVARRFALVAAAGELAGEYKITGWEQTSAYNAAVKCFHHWIQCRGGVEAKEPEIALAQVRHFFELHGESRFSPWCSEMTFIKTNNRAGFRRDGEFFVFPEVFKQDICAGLNPKYVARLCVDKGWLVSDGTGRAVSSHRMPDTGATKRVYHFSQRVFDDS